MSDEKKFNYSYFAPTAEQRKKIESIKKDYSQKDDFEIKMDKLNKLDDKVKRGPMIFSLTLGIVGILSFGLGLTFVLEWNKLLLGIIIGIVSCIPLLSAYPTYLFYTKKLKDKYGDEILKLSEELLDYKGDRCEKKEE